MVDTTKAKIRSLFIHRVGNRLRQEGYVRSRKAQVLSDSDELALLLFFLGQIHNAEAYRFAHPVSVERNEVLHACHRSFEDASTFAAATGDLAALLYEASTHPRIKAGNVYFALLDGISFNGKATLAIGIFKSESAEQFLKVEVGASHMMLVVDQGTRISAVDKVALIFPNASKGMELLTISARGDDSVYWHERFLKVEPAGSEKSHTRDYLHLCQVYSKEAIPESIPSDRALFLNRTLDYFQNTEKFDHEDFGRIFDNPAQRKQFAAVQQRFEETRGEKLPVRFAIAKQVVSRQRRHFQKNLHLDEHIEVRLNFETREEMEAHVEQGFDKKRSMPFYKLYYKPRS